jgi:large subunit ribosomal protein L15
MRLNEIRDRDGATKAKKRLGRGIGSGLGKTSGRGTKGQKARSGVAIKGFEGGQMPLHRRLPKRGFNNIFAKKYNELNLGRIQEAVDAGRLDGRKPITVGALKDAGLIRREKDGVRLLGHGEIKSKLAFEVTGASGSAIKAVEAAGGTVTLKSITGRERPAADQIKADRRAAKRDAVAARTQAKSGKAAKAEGEQPAAAPEAKPDKTKAKAEAAKPAKAKPDQTVEAPAPEAAAPKAPKNAKADEGEAKKPKPKPAPAKKDKS